MTLIRRSATRTILSGAEKTHLTDTPNADTLAFNLTTSSEFYVGFKQKFCARYFAMGAVNSVASVVTVKYWDGSTWSAVKDLIDQTVGFTKSGFISWMNEDDWTKKNISPITDEDEELYWIQITVSVNLHASTTLQAVLNLFCDDDLLAQYYPELISDSRWLPEDQTTFLSQYVAAKDLVVTRLKKGADPLIKDESEIIDPNVVALAAVHAAAYIIRFPVAESDEDRAKLNSIREEMDNEINLISIAVDSDNSGEITDGEKQTGQYFRAR